MINLLYMDNIAMCFFLSKQVSMSWEFILVNYNPPHLDVMMNADVIVIQCFVSDIYIDNKLIGVNLS